jgi:hypothetical protein
MNTAALGKVLIVIGLLVAAAGAFLYLAHKIPFLGRLPGDIVIQRKNFTFYFPLATSLVVSIAVSCILWLLSKR